MALKLITKIRKWLDEEAAKTHPSLQILESKNIDKGYFYDIKTDHIRFCLILQDLKEGPKMNWVFHREFTQDEISYWKGRYTFKLLEEETKEFHYTKSRLQIKDVDNEEPIKVIMARKADTMRKFTKDLKWILVMGKTGGRAK